MALWPLQLPLLLLDCDSKYISSQSSFLIHPVWQYPITDTLFLGVSYGVCRLRTALIGEPSAVSQDKTEHAADKMSPSRIPEGGGIIGHGGSEGMFAAARPLMQLTY